MAYSHTNSRGQTYYLHSKDVQLRGSGRNQTIYYFAKEVKAEAQIAINAPINQPLTTHIALPNFMSRFLLLSKTLSTHPVVITAAKLT